MPNEIKGIKVNGTPYKIDYESLANQPFGEIIETALLPETEITVNVEISQ